MKKNNFYRLEVGSWGIIRVVYLVAGMMILLFGLLTILNKNFIFAILFIGAMLVNFSLTGYCPMAIFLDKIGLRR